ncbi:hypothetical protein [Streptomyces fumanus]|uniref:Lipoprotein n=1 Tax=Streptomyces fumanus TaxID=67302 RepID=A0A919A411_9ACTN|nr:hypothetical protein [Streptomyces fumanus]GHE84980.1 hypothetical protein GCM10018772_05160 [Streptomyces fumanus]
MTRTTTALLAAVVLLGGGAAGCSESKSQDEIAKDCVAALKARAEGDKGKPKDCEGLGDDDYDALLMSHVLTDDLGWVDEDGNVDREKMLDDATSQP